VPDPGFMVDEVLLDPDRTCLVYQAGNLPARVPAPWRHDARHTAPTTTVLSR
jgi:hypothetical protein